MDKNRPLYEVRNIETLRDMLEQSYKLYADKALFKTKYVQGEEYREITFRQYYEDVNALGTAMMLRGMQGGRVAIVAKTRYEWCVAYMAAVNGVGVIVPLDKELPENEMLNCITRSESTVIFYEEHEKKKLFSLKSELPNVIWVGMDEDEDSPEENVYSYKKMLEEGRIAFLAGERAYLDTKIDREAMNILLFTSGTTADAKAVMLSHKNICKNLMAMCAMTYIDDKDVFLSVLPLHHTYECTCGFLCQVYRGCTIAHCEGLRYITKNMKEAQPTMMLAVPLLIENMHKKIFTPENRGKLRLLIKISNGLMKVGIDIRKTLFKKVHDVFGGKMRLLVLGGAKIDPSVLKDIRDMGIHCVQGYGLTECAPILALNRDCNFRDDSAGLPLPDVDVKVVNKDEDGIGEIIGKGDNVMIGYYKADELTAEAIKDGYYYTGDLGYMTEENFVIITGRKKNVIVTKNGKNVFPEEIEFLLAKSDYIEESVVYGENDDKGELQIVAEIFPAMDAIRKDHNGKCDEETLHDVIDEVVKAVNAQMVTYKYIKTFKLRDKEFEKTTSKKIRRNIQKVD